MSQVSIIAAVKKVYEKLDNHLSVVAQKAGLKCPVHCGACCIKSDIEASPVEFLPLAAWLYETNQVDEYLEKLENSSDGLCVNFSPEARSKGEWGCSQYEYRGLICRLFGYGFRLNREGIPGLVTCKIMKNTISDSVILANKIASEEPDEVPIFSNYFMQLYAIDPDMALKQIHINDAIRMAIEILYFHYAHLREEEITDNI
jgi:uncharacterized protein